MKIYAIPGLGADKRVFEYLHLDYELVALEWIQPQKRENLKNYALRLAKSIDTSEPYGILGVSFGGMIAVEIAKVYNPKMTILLSTAETHKELRWIYRTIGKINLLYLLPKASFNISISIAWVLFGTKHPILKQILDDTDSAFAKWAAIAISKWKNHDRLDNCLKISGAKDKILPPKHPDILLIPDAQHFMIVDKAVEISALINSNVAKKLR